MYSVAIFGRLGPNLRNPADGGIRCPSVCRINSPNALHGSGHPLLFSSFAFVLSASFWGTVVNKKSRSVPQIRLVYLQSLLPTPRVVHSARQTALLDFDHFRRFRPCVVWPFLTVWAQICGSRIASSYHPKFAQIERQIF